MLIDSSKGCRRLGIGPLPANGTSENGACAYGTVRCVCGRCGSCAGGAVRVRMDRVRTERIVCEWNVCGRNG